MAETILGVPVKAAPKELTRVLDTVVDLTDKAQSVAATTTSPLDWRRCGSG